MSCDMLAKIKDKYMIDKTNETASFNNIKDKVAGRGSGTGIKRNPCMEGGLSPRLYSFESQSDDLFRMSSPSLTAHFPI